MSRRRQGWTSIIAVALLAMTTSGAGAKSAGCDARMEAVDWKTVVAKPLPPEKTAPEVPDAGINSATPADTSTQPFSLTGRFLSSVGKDKRYCTAQFVDRNIILTAAHCVRDKDGTWLDRFEFAPPGVDAITEAHCAATTSNWVTGATGNFFWPADFALVVLKEPVVESFMTLETAPTPADEIVTAVGFPKQIEDGARLYEVQGVFLEASELDEEPGLGEATGAVIHGEPRYGLGISGGGWMVPPKAEDPEGRFRVVGLSVTSRFVAAYGPRFGQCALQLLEFARQGCGLK